MYINYVDDKLCPEAWKPTKNSYNSYSIKIIIAVSIPEVPIHSL